MSRFYKNSGSIESDCDVCDGSGTIYIDIPDHPDYDFVMEDCFNCGHNLEEEIEMPKKCEDCNTEHWPADGCEQTLIQHHGIAYERFDHPHYKYKLSFRYEMYSGLSTPYDAVGNQYTYLEPDGKLVIKMGYAWDGPSGPTIDTQDFMRGSLIHDAFYQLLREGKFYTKINHDIVRKHADHLLYQACREDGMSWFRAKYVYWSVRMLAGKAADHDYNPGKGQLSATARVKLTRGDGPITPNELLSREMRRKIGRLNIPPTKGKR